MIVINDFSTSWSLAPTSTSWSLAPTSAALSACQRRYQRRGGSAPTLTASSTVVNDLHRSGSKKQRTGLRCCQRDRLPAATNDLGISERWEYPESIFSFTAIAASSPAVSRHQGYAIKEYKTEDYQNQFETEDYYKNQQKAEDYYKNQDVH